MDTVYLFNFKLNQITAQFKKKGNKSNKISNAPPWIDSECLKVMKERDILLKKALKSGLTTDRQLFTLARNKVVNKLRKAKASFFINIINEAKGNNKIIWKNINKLTGKKQNIASDNLEININNVLVRDPLAIATEMNAYFINSVSEITQQFAPIEHVNYPDNYSLTAFKIDEISDVDVLSIINSLNHSKAKDVHGFDTHFLKLYKDSLISPIKHLLNLSFRQSVVPPASWLWLLQF